MKHTLLLAIPAFLVAVVAKLYGLVAGALALMVLVVANGIGIIYGPKIKEYLRRR